MSDVQGPANNPLLTGIIIGGNQRVYTSAEDSEEIVWAHGGQVNPASNETGPPWVAPYNLTLHTMILTLAGATNVTLTVGTYRSGVLLRTDTIVAATLVATYALDISMRPGQTLQPVLLAVATGTGIGLAITYRYTPSPPEVQIPLFTEEGPAFYAAAFAHNSPFATPGPYQLALSGPDETAFRAWITAESVPFDPDATTVDYDMRSFWKLDPSMSAWHTGSHFPDTYKTPYDTTFSKESIYATPDCPFEWIGDQLIDTRDGTLIFE